MPTVLFFLHYNNIIHVHVVNGIIPLQAILTCLHGAVCDVLSDVDMDNKVSCSLESTFAGDGPYGRLFAGLETSHQQTKYYKEHFQLIVSSENVYKLHYYVYEINYVHELQEPEKIVLGTIREYKGIGAKRRCIEKEEIMMYVPILKTLDLILQNETILAEVRG